MVYFILMLYLFYFINQVHLLSCFFLWYWSKRICNILFVSLLF